LVPGPTRVISSFCSRLIMALLPVATDARSLVTLTNIRSILDIQQSTESWQGK
jgi:hypothetical protein